MDSTQPGPSDNDHDPNESRGLGPVIQKDKPGKQEIWKSLPGTGGRIEYSNDDPPRWRTNIPPPK